MLKPRSWIAAATLLASGVGLALSCQHRDPDAVGAAVPRSAEAAAIKPQTATADSQKSTAIDYKALGFSFPPAPDRDHMRGPSETGALNAACIACHSPDAHTMHQIRKKSTPAASQKDEAERRESQSISADGVSCVDCHGGNWQVSVPADIARSDPRYQALTDAAHVRPLHPEFWRDSSGKLSSAKPQILGAAALRESVDYIRFVNPGDLRAARVACAGCHAKEVARAPTSMMAHGAMLWEAALYNNGAINRKTATYGEIYAPGGSPAAVLPPQPVTRGELIRHGTLPELLPLPRWEITQPGNILRVFERGGRFRPVVGIPEPEEDPGRPDVKLSVRGFGTDVRTDPVFIGLQKTRLLDPTLNFFGTNDHPGDYRSSGCTACHVVYANDRDPVHSAFWSDFGNRGESFSTDSAVNPSATTRPYAAPWDPSRKTRESGHPVQHVFVKDMPTSTCIVCHVHPGTNVLNSFLGYMWWDNESDGQVMYPRKQKYPSSDDQFRAAQHNPEATAARGLWSNLYPDDRDHLGNKAGADFLEKLGTVDFNQKLKHVQFADFHGHGWVFRKVYKQNRRGEMVDASDVSIMNDPNRWSKAIHLQDVHLEKGMHCVDCHFAQDAHGDGNLYGETRNAVLVDCIDCHGTAERPATILAYLKNPKADNADAFLRAAFTGNTSGGVSGDEVLERNRKMIEDHFERDQNGALIQKSVIYSEMAERMGSAGATNTEIETAAKKNNLTKEWQVVQVPETSDTARYAHSMRRNGKWGATPLPTEKEEGSQLAHSNTRVSCYACHSSWNTSCFGCHLPQRANQRTTMLHNEGALTRNYTNYNYQTLRDDIYMLCKDSTVKGGKVVPVRSACAVVVSSQDANRQWIYTQQQTVSAEGFAGTAFSPNFPHTVRGAETKQCVDCHVATKGDNNAIMAQLLMQGTNAVNFVGRFAWVAEDDGGLEAVAVTERDEPQAVIGSRLHELAYPDFFKKHRDRTSQLAEAYHHDGTVLDLQLRGEYLYAACGKNGFIAYDVAHIDNKGFSERIITAPVSPLGQRFYISSKYATSICSPSTMAIDPTRPRLAENQEGLITRIGTKTIPVDPNRPVRPIHPIYAYLYLTDREEGLIVIGNPPDSPNKPGVSTLLDGNPDNNFLKRATTFNKEGILHGARAMTFYGTLAYVVCDRGLVVLDMNDPLNPCVVPAKELAVLKHPRKITFQFRYGFVIDDDGLKVINVMDPKNPTIVQGARIPIPDARDIYVCRTYGYIAAGRQGLLIIDLETPEQPKQYEAFDDNGHINDANAVRVGMTNSSLYAYIASGHNGLQVVELTSPDDTPTYMGFSPQPKPRSIAWFSTRGPALALSKGQDRDRAVDEAGNQLSVFNRIGSRPFTFEEQRALYMHKDANGERTQFYTVTNETVGDPIEAAAPPTVTPPTGDAPAESQPAETQPVEPTPPPRRDPFHRNK